MTCPTCENIELLAVDLFPDWAEGGRVPLRLTPSGEAKARKAKAAGVQLLLEIDPSMFLTKQSMRSGYSAGLA